MDHQSLTRAQQEFIAAEYQIRLSDLSNAIVAGKQLSVEELSFGLDLVKGYYKYLAECGIPYGETALAVVNKRGFVGRLTDTHFERQLQFEGIQRIPNGLKSFCWSI